MLERRTAHASDPAAEADRHAYNAAFEELCLTWHWDAATYARLQPQGKSGLRAYLEAEHSHLLRAYDADFLVNAIESAKARCRAGMAGTRANAAQYSALSGNSLDRLAA